mmetsp:Transcript_14511/g.29485  ORF Transcript_14511/g.29485 Transcript_14511/m.29485 type:complete len:237 (-) Transcript_14511:96-806(-)
MAGAPPSLAILPEAVKGAGVRDRPALAQRRGRRVQEALERALAHALHAQLQEAPHEGVLGAQLGRQVLAGLQAGRGRHLRGGAAQVQDTHERLTGHLQARVDVLGEVVRGDQREDALLAARDGASAQPVTVEREVLLQETALEAVVDGALHLLGHQPHARSGEDGDRNRGVRCLWDLLFRLQQLRPHGVGGLRRRVLEGAERRALAHVCDLHLAVTAHVDSEEVDASPSRPSVGHQ